MKIKFNLLLACLFLAINTAFADFAVMTHLSHDCGEGGAVTFELVGDPSAYTYYWEHGPTDLSINNLSPGIYTLVVTNFYGCIEEYDVEILELGGCQMYSQVQYPIGDPCSAIITIVVFTASGDIIDEQALDVVWADGNPSGLNRTVNTGIAGNYCVTISMAGENSSSCCLLYDCIHISANPNCKKKCTEKVLLNEVNKNNDGSGQFVELLVTGECECEKNTDIRGLILDDNNGFLIPGNEYVNAFSIEQTIGINPGYLIFSDNNVWKEVPNGSLIVIYDANDGTIPNFPNDDPTDADGDGVYVLEASNSDYFYAKTGSWNEAEKSMEYSGGSINTSWDIIDLSNPADGIQIRTEDGLFHHGISVGESDFSEPNNFTLWLSSNNISNRNCQLIGSNYWDKNDFDCFDADQQFQSPGLANSSINNDLRESLKDCDYNPKRILYSNTTEENINPNKDLHSTKKEWLNAYPNPFTSLINLQYNSEIEGTATIRLYSTSGQLLLEKNNATNEGDNLYQIELDAGLASSILILEFTFPSGKKESLRLTHYQLD